MYVPTFPSAAQSTLRFAYQGEPLGLFKLALRTGLLTVLTLGLYRFWAKTRIRRYLWSATSAGGAPFEYTGTGAEKLVGFLIAIAILVTYLGVVQMGLVLLGLSVFASGPDGHSLTARILAGYAVLPALLPLLFLARYQGRRYLLSRTRWRGIRFGALPGALGYMWRGLAYTTLSIASLGLLIPLQLFQLEKYLTDRTCFGTARLRQNGHWTMLYAPMKHLGAGLALILLGVVCAVFTPYPLVPTLGVFAGYIWAMVGYVYFAIHSFNRLTRTKTLGDGIGLSADLHTGPTLRLYVVGIALTFAISLLFLLPFGLLLAGLGVTGDMPDPLSDPMLLADPMLPAYAGILLLAYLVVFVAIAASALVCITQPVLRYYVSHLSLQNAATLGRIDQRPHAALRPAEGFAEALDIGGGF